MDFRRKHLGLWALALASLLLMAPLGLQAERLRLALSRRGSEGEDTLQSNPDELAQASQEQAFGEEGCQGELCERNQESKECEGADCEQVTFAQECEGEACGQKECEGDSCGQQEECEGDACGGPSSSEQEVPCEGEDCESDGKDDCSGDACEQKDTSDQENCEGGECDHSDCSGEDCDKPQPSMLNQLSLSDLGDASDPKSFISLAAALKDHLHEAAKVAALGFDPPAFEEPSEMTDLINEGRRCRHTQYPIIVIDGGSTGTRAALFRAEAKACPGVGKKILPDTIIFLEEGEKQIGLRQAINSFLDKTAGEDWASKPYDSQHLIRSFGHLQVIAKDMIERILDHAVTRFPSYFTDFELAETKTVGIPVLFFSTAGVRDTHDWFRRGLFVSSISAINRYNRGHGFNFFTNEKWTRPIPGVEEGVLAFIASNHLLGNLAKAKELGKRIEREEDPKKREKLQVQLGRQLTGIVEVGGASMQIVFQVSQVANSPSFVQVVNLVGAGYLSGEYPAIDVMSTSFMQMGVSSAVGIFLKVFCSEKKNLVDGVCQNPCLPKGFEQTCSTAAVSFKNGKPYVPENPSSARLSPAATYCTSSNAEISKKPLSRLACLGSGIDPDQSYSQRLSIAGCSKIQGTGDFYGCSAAVNQILLNPKLPLPANQEASFTGFDTAGQIFQFMAASTKFVLTGKGIVMPIMDLQKLGLLDKSFEGNADELRDAAFIYCDAPVVQASSGLVRNVHFRGETKVDPVNSWNLENCFKLSYGYGLLKLLNEGEVRPSGVSFEVDILNKKGEKIGEYGWPTGAVLREVLDVGAWAREAYVLGQAFTTKDRWNNRERSIR